jgi:hypothetical protein
MTEQLVIYDPADELEPSQRDALRGDWGVASVRTRLALRRAAPGADAVVLSAVASLSWAPAFHELAEYAPTVPRLIVASIAFRPRRALLEAARQGALLFFAPSPAALRRGVREVLRRDPWPAGAAALLEKALRRLPNGELRSLIGHAASHGARTVPVPEFAALLGHSPRTLARRCEAVGCPPPRALVEWGRVLHAATLRELAGGGEPAEDGSEETGRSREPSARPFHLRLDAKESVPLASAVDALVAECRGLCVPLRAHPAPRLSLMQGGRR